jgi:hypothetical protein
MRTIEHSIEIAAPPEVVWDVLTDVDAYPHWNPFLAMDRAPTAVGETLHITVRPGRRSMTFRPTLTVLDDRREISWLGRFLVRGLVDGAHALHLESTASGGTLFRQRETFSGLLVPFLSSMLRDTLAGFAAMNTALAARAELATTPGQ